MIGSLNSTATLVDEFHAPLGIESSRQSLQTTPWWEALRDPQQRSTAGKEVGPKAAEDAITVGALGLPVLVKVNKSGGKSGACTTE